MMHMISEKKTCLYLDKWPKYEKIRSKNISLGKVLYNIESKEDLLKKARKSGP